MPIFKDEIKARVKPENLRDVELEIIQQEAMCECQNCWVVADGKTGEVLGLYTRPYTINETHLLEETKNRDKYEDREEYVIYKVDPDELVVMKHEMWTNNDTTSCKKDPHIAKRTLNGRRLKPNGSRNEELVERLNYTPPELRVSQVSNNIVQPEIVVPKVPAIVIAHRLTTSRGEKLKINFKGDFIKPAVGRVLSIYICYFDENQQKKLKRYNEELILFERINHDAVDGLELEAVEVTRDNHTVVQVVLTSNDGGSDCGMVNRELKVEVIPWESSL